MTPKNEPAGEGRNAERDARLETLGRIVRDLRDLSERVRALGVPGERVRVFFPARESGETQPVRLENYVDVEELAGLLHYVADMMEA